MALSHHAPRYLRAFGFPTASRLRRLASPRICTPWPVIQNGRCTSEDAHPSKTTRFHALFTLREEFFSAFPHGTGFAIGLATYLGLEVVVPQLGTPFPRRATQDTHTPSPPSTTGLSPSLALRSRRLYLGGGRLKTSPATPHLRSLSGEDSVCPLLFSVALTHSIPIGFFSCRY